MAAPTAQEHAYCRAIVRRKARSFYFASTFLPASTRRDVYALYAFYRTVDDLVDTRVVGCDDSAIRHELNAWRQWLHCRQGQPGCAALRTSLAYVLERHAIPLCYFDHMLDGLEADLEPRELRTFDELEQYCYRVAGTVGQVMACVLGVRDMAALEHASALGIAMQLTNILRDVSEDLDRGTIYLPADELALFGYSRARLYRRTADSDFVALMRMQISRARDFYRQGLAGISSLSPECRFPIVLAAHVYGGILRKIEARDYDVFARRVRTRLPEKLWIAGRSYVTCRTHYRWHAGRQS